MKPFERGLVVGKFAPLHLGHEAVVRAAIERCREVVLVSYSRPELPGCEPERRARWLAARFPECTALVVTRALLAARGLDVEVPPNDAPADEQRGFVALLCTELLGLEVDAVFTSEAYGDGFARALTRHFRAWRPGCREVTHVSVDPARHAQPISASRIRADVHAQRRFLAPEVYASFVERVAVLGGESSGKTSLCEALARELCTSAVLEYGRELWLEKRGRLELEDLLRIAVEQVRREETALGAARRFLFCDTSPLTTAFYSRDLFGRVDPELARLAERPYAFTVLCAPDFPFVQDGTRRDAEFRAAQHAFYVRALAGKPYVLAEGALDARVLVVRRALAAGAG